MQKGKCCKTKLKNKNKKLMKDRMVEKKEE